MIHSKSDILDISILFLLCTSLIGAMNYQHNIDNEENEVKTGRNIYYVFV